MTSTAELTLSAQLEQAGIPFEAEFRFHPSRKWRADFIVWHQYANPEDREYHLLIEIDGGGYIAGRHSRGKGMEADCEKASAAAILGYRVIRVTPRQVEEGLALEWIRAAFGLKVAA